MLDVGFRMLDPGCRMLNVVCKMLDVGCRIELNGMLSYPIQSYPILFYLLLSGKNQG